jgi:hypothetical protein
MPATTPAALAALSDQDLLAEAALAADLTREADNLDAEAKAFELLLELLGEISRREELAPRLASAVTPRLRQSLMEAA